MQGVTAVVIWPERGIKLLDIHNDLTRAKHRLLNTLLHGSLHIVDLVDGTRRESGDSSEKGLYSI